MKTRHSTYSLLLAFFFLAFSATSLEAAKSLDRIDQAVQEFLETQWGQGNVEWIPYGKQRDFKKFEDYEFRIRENIKPRGKTILQVEVINGRSVERVIPYRIEIIAFDTVPVLNTDYERNQELAKSDISWERRDVSRLRSQWVSVESELLSENIWTRKRMKEGDILYKKNIEKKPEVILGDPVTIMVMNGSVNLKVPGIARQNGKVGDIIKVVNTQYNNILRVRVKDKALVVLEQGSI